MKRNIMVLIDTMVPNYYNIHKIDMVLQKRPIQYVQTTLWNLTDLQLALLL